MSARCRCVSEKVELEIRQKTKDSTCMAFGLSGRHLGDFWLQPAKSQSCLSIVLPIISTSDHCPLQQSGNKSAFLT